MFCNVDWMTSNSLHSAKLTFLNSFESVSAAISYFNDKQRMSSMTTGHVSPIANAVDKVRLADKQFCLCNAIHWLKVTEG